MNHTIIDPDFVIADELKHTIIYGDGAHSRDLRNKGLLPTGTKKHTAHHILMPIITVESAVLELLKKGILQGNIISWAGVMSKTPNGTPSVHLLSGPAATTNLKIAVAMETFGKRNVLMRKLFEIMSDNDVKIIETGKTEHDAKMAVIQGLINLWIVMVGETKNENLITQVLNDWKTPAGTIVDMIHANPFAELLIKNFFESLKKHRYNASTALQASIKTNLSAEDIQKFGTPNSDRVMRFIAEGTNRIIVASADVSALRNNLNTYGHRSLNERIGRIRASI